MDVERLKEKLQNRLKRSGNVPDEVFMEYLKEYKTFDDIEPLQLKFKSKNRNMELIQKFYWWVLTTLTIGFLGSSLVSLKSLATKYYNNGFSNIIESWFLLALAYIIIVGGSQIIIQSARNRVQNRLTLINERIEILKGKNNND